MLLKTVTIRATLLALCATLPLSAHAMADTPKQVDIDAGDLSTALLQLSNEYSADLVYRPEQVYGLKTYGAHGSFTTEQAVTKLLEGTKLKLTMSTTGAMLIVAPGSNASSPVGGKVSIQAAGEDSDKGEPKDGKKSSSGGFRVAQVDQGQAASDSSVEGGLDDQASKPKPVQLEEVVVTGSHLARTTSEGPQEVKTYTRTQIEQSGQTTVTDFLNSLPEVSTSISENGDQIYNGATTVKLHGLPVGTTLVLINGHRVETSGAQFASNIFDLNNIPLTAIEKIEIVPTGSSAVYGSDALAGVVNIILKKDFDGLAVDSRYGSTSDGAEGEVTSDASWGKRWSRGAVSVMGSYQTRSELSGSERALTANNDYQAFGGGDYRSTNCNPGNVYSTNGANLPGLSAPQAGIPTSSSGHLTISDFSSSAGVLNKCSSEAYASIIPDTHRLAFYGAGNFQLSSSIEFFAEVLYSHLEEFVNVGFYPVSATVPAANPFNPFGEAVNVDFLADTQNGLFENEDAVFSRPLVGARGEFLQKWHWEVTAWESKDREKNTLTGLLNSAALTSALAATDPAQSVNLFATGAAASSQLLNSLYSSQLTTYLSRTDAVEAILRGSLFQLPSGSVDVAIGSQYAADKLSTDNGYQAATVYRRNLHSFFGEARVPLLADHDHPDRGDELALSVAGRYDDYSDFGSKTTPQAGLEWRPFESLLLRGAYGKAFVSPSLYQLYAADYTRPTTVTDPEMGPGVHNIQYTGGGSRSLNAETGQTRSLGAVYASEQLPGLRLSVTHWGIDLNNSIQALAVQSIVDNESLFTGAVTRDPVSGQIISVNDQYRNFGSIRVAGFDFSGEYALQTDAGKFTPSIAVTEVYRYSVALVPGAAPTNRVGQAYDDGNFSPRWKGTAAVGWMLGNISASIDGRYVGRYLDYDSTTRELGNFWLFDTSAKYVFNDLPAREKSWLGAPYLSIGAVNLFNSLPKYSNFDGGNVGYDPAEYEIRGRFLYVQVGSRW